MSSTNGWTIVDWDGNPSLGYRCWRKKFRMGHVSVGIGDFTQVVFSYGANSEDSYGGTRWRGVTLLSPEEAMRQVDKGDGYKMET